MNIIICSAFHHIPVFISDVLTLNFNSISTRQVFTHYEKIDSTNNLATRYTLLLHNLSLPIINTSEFIFNTAFSLKNLTINTGSKKILQNINWVVKNGEKWALCGRNGAGKSMLLSVIFADHPQAYANQIVLFDKMRGSGESIWEIRENIGYFSSELFMYADKTETVREIAYKQMRSNPYKFIPVSQLEENSIVNLLDFFSLGHYVDSPIQAIPASRQRLTFLLTIFMKNAPLIILDEPFHGFDFKLIEKMKAFLNEYCKDRTLVFVTHRKQEIPTIVDKSFTIRDSKGETNFL